MQLLRQFLRYLVVGGIAFVVDYATLVFLTSLVGIYHLVSAAIAFALGIATTYVLSIFWVFPSRVLQDKWAEFALFAIIGVLGLGLTEACMYVGTDRLGLPYQLSKLIAVALVLFWNFGMRKVLLFREVRVPSHE